MPDSDLTPMFRQWQAVKRQYPGTLLLFRMGDFYEMFGEDATTGARELELTLTSRECGKGRRIPMCGVPHHAIQRYLRVLIKKGYRAAICDQVEDPRKAKGLVKREVTRVVTPGTLLEDEFLDSTSGNFLTAVCREGDVWGLASADISTGDFVVTEISPAAAASGDGLLGAQGHPREAVPDAVCEELARIEPAEIVAPSEIADALEAQGAPAHITAVPGLASGLKTPADRLMAHFGVSSLEGFGVGQMTAGIAAGADVLEYLAANHLDSLPHLRTIRPYSLGDFMLLDAATKRNLELTRTIRGDAREGSLLDLLDRTITPMGGRTLQQ